MMTGRDDLFSDLSDDLFSDLSDDLFSDLSDDCFSYLSDDRPSYLYDDRFSDLYDDSFSDLYDDRLSNLSDDLLRRILYFVPYKDAAKTSVLSRRWGSLWRSSGAVNLAVQVWSSRQSREDAFYSWQRRQYEFGGSSCSYQEAEDAFYKRQEAFVQGAKAALDAAEVPITRLTLRVESDDRSIDQFLSRSRNWRTQHYSVVDNLLSHPAARHVEELQIATVADSYSLLRDTVYGLASIPSSDILRVLDLTRCNLTAAFPLPRLATLRLRHCSVEAKVLRALLDAAPELTTVELEPLSSLPSEEPPVLRLSFHAVTTLVLSSCDKQGVGDHRRKCNWAIEIDAPRLQYFKYKGLVRPFVLRPAAAAVAGVDLHFLQDNDANTRALFWQFLHNSTNARTLRLKVDNNLRDIAAIGETRHALQCAFPCVERLELEGAFDPRVDCPESVWCLEGFHYRENGTAAKAIANLIDCCPVLGEFMLKLRAVSASVKARYGEEFLKKKDRSDYSKSIDRFVCHRKSKTAISMEDSIFGDKYSYDDVPGIPGLSDRSFACLQRTLRRVGMQFRLDKNSISSCLGLRLIKFFADHARVLEEMCVDTGNRRLQEHLNFNVETQALALALAHQLQCGNTGTLDSTIDLAKSTTGFTVLPLQRQERVDWKSSSL